MSLSLSSSSWCAGGPRYEAHVASQDHLGAGELPPGILNTTEDHVCSPEPTCGEHKYVDYTNTNIRVFVVEVYNTCVIGIFGEVPYRF